MKETFEQNPAFDKLYQELVSAMVDTKTPDIPYIEKLLVDISKMHRLSKGVTRVYRNQEEERRGGGETLCCFDTGKEGKPVHSVRVVTSVMSSATLTVYMSPDTLPLSAEELYRVDLVMRTTLSFVSRNRLRDIVEELAFCDDKGYRNFRSFVYSMNQFAARGELRGKAAINYNLRHFSLVNEELGRKIGDLVMRKHYETLQHMIIGAPGVIRLGGDNFVAVCDQEQLPEVVAFLTEAPIEYDMQEGSCINIACCAGVYCLPDDFVLRDPGDVMAKIVAALRVAQSGGRERIVIYDDEILKNREKSMRVQQNFPEALRSEEFHVFYQPKVNIQTGELSGAEALCRWFHKGTIVPPGDFIPVLEETNDICKLDFYMLDHVCRDIRRWLDEGRQVVRVSVNLSRKHMMDAHLLTSIFGIIDRYQIPHEYLEIELTETTTDVEFRDLKRVVGGLQRAGIYTSVDDFGMGYSSLNLIREIPWNVLKVDRSFLPLEEDGSDSTRSIMFKYVVAMAKALGLECIAEGVETRSQLEILRENNCDHAQGFYFDKPLPVSEFEGRLAMHSYTIPDET